MILLTNFIWEELHNTKGGTACFKPSKDFSKDTTFLQKTKNSHGETSKQGFHESKSNGMLQEKTW